MKYLTLLIPILLVRLAIGQNPGKIVVVDNTPTNLTEENWKSSIPKSDVDTVFDIDSSVATAKYGQYLGKSGLLMINTISEAAVVKYKIERLKYGDGNPLVFVDGKQIPYDNMNNINPTDVDYFQMLKKLPEIDLKKYGPQAVNGIVLIKMKKP